MNLDCFNSLFDLLSNSYKLMLMRKFNCHWNYYLSFTLPKLQSNLVNSSVNSIFFFAVFSRIIRAKFVKANDVIPLSILTYSNLGELIVGLDRP